MTSAIFKHIDPSTIGKEKPWTKVDGPGQSFKMMDVERPVHNIRGEEQKFSTEISGFAVYDSPAKEKAFTDEKAIREGYYREVEELLKKTHPGVKKVVIFDHTIRRREKSSPRQPVQQVHVDQTPEAVAVRVRRHVPAEEAEELLRGRYALINVWRPIANPATDFPLAVIDWRSTSPEDFVPTDLLYPERPDSAIDSDDRGKEQLPDASQYFSTEGYEARGETMGVAPNEQHKFYYVKDMTPDEVLMLKCYDSFGQGQPNGRHGLAVRTPHTAFIDPQTPIDTPGRQSIELRCLIFYE